MHSGRILFVFAHPDDETFGTGGTIAKYSDSGKEIYLATATKGEAGMLGDPPFATRENVGEVRAEEVKKAGEVLGIKEIFFMGFIDGKLLETPMNHIIDKTVYAIRKFHPHVIVSFGKSGVSGHPDHIVMSRVSEIAFKDAGDPSFIASNGSAPELPAWQAKKLYHFEIPKEIIRRARIDLDGVSFKDITTIIDTSEFIDRKIEAFYCHKTQVKDYERILSRPNYRKFAEREYYLLVDSVDMETIYPESDLFQGIKP